MGSITISKEFSEREEFFYSFVLMSNIYDEKDWCKEEQLSKLVADIKKELLSDLEEYKEILPLLSNQEYQLSFFTNCRRLLLSEDEYFSLNTEEMISHILSDDPTEMIARIFITADNNKNNLDFYRKLINDSIEAVKYCLKMNVSEKLRSMLLSLLVDKEKYTKKIIEFTYYTLKTMRSIFSKYSFQISKAYEKLENTKRINDNFKKLGIIKGEENIILIPVLLNPSVIYSNTIGKLTYFVLGTDYEQHMLEILDTPPTIELETIGKIFSDTTRCEIIRILQNGSSYLSELARLLKMPTNSLHYHIQQLSEAQVIKGYYEGKRFIYELNPNFFYTVSHTALQLIQSEKQIATK